MDRSASPGCPAAAERLRQQALQVRLPDVDHVVDRVASAEGRPLPLFLACGLRRGRPQRPVLALLAEQAVMEVLAEAGRTSRTGTPCPCRRTSRCRWTSRSLSRPGPLRRRRPPLPRTWPRQGPRGRAPLWRRARCRPRCASPSTRTGARCPGSTRCPAPSAARTPCSRNAAGGCRLPRQQVVLHVQPRHRLQVAPDDAIGHDAADGGGFASPRSIS